jgi:hypothetical protein
MNGESGTNWRQLCAAATEEPDSNKLVSLVQQILQALDEEERDCKTRRTSVPGGGDGAWPTPFTLPPPR